MDVDKCIELVNSHTCLWDPSDASYHLRDRQRKAWRQIAQEMEISVEELKKKWRGLRDTFGKELKKVAAKKPGHTVSETDSKWLYFKPLFFLKNTMSRRDQKGPDTYQISDDEDIKNVNIIIPQSPSQSSDETTQKIKLPVKKKVRKRHLDETDSEILGENSQSLKQNTNDPDAQFLMSLLPFLKDIPKHRKLIVRSKLQQVFIEEDMNSSNETFM